MRRAELPGYGLAVIGVRLAITPAPAAISSKPRPADDPAWGWADRAGLRHNRRMGRSPGSPLLERCRQRASLHEQARAGLVEAVREAARAGHTTEEIAAAGLAQSAVRDWAAPEGRRVRPGPEPGEAPRARR